MLQKIFKAGLEPCSSSIIKHFDSVIFFLAINKLIKLKTLQEYCVLESLEMVLGTKLCLIIILFFFIYIMIYVYVLYDTNAHHLNNWYRYFWQDIHRICKLSIIWQLCLDFSSFHRTVNLKSVKSHIYKVRLSVKKCIFVYFDVIKSCVLHCLF